MSAKAATATPCWRHCRKTGRQAAVAWLMLNQRVSPRVNLIADSITSLLVNSLANLLVKPLVNKSPMVTAWRVSTTRLVGGAHESEFFAKKLTQSGSALELESAPLASASLSPLLSLSDGLAYRGSKVIELPEIAINRAEILGIWGDSGCGKSTMAAILTGLMPLAAGKLECCRSSGRFAAALHPFSGLSSSRSRRST